MENSKSSFYESWVPSDWWIVYWDMVSQVPSLTIIGQWQRSNKSINWPCTLVVKSMTTWIHDNLNPTWVENHQQPKNFVWKTFGNLFRLKQFHICHHHLTLVRGTGSRISFRGWSWLPGFWDRPPQRIPWIWLRLRSMGIPIHQIRIIQQNPKQTNLKTSFQTLVSTRLHNCGSLTSKP